MTCMGCGEGCGKPKSILKGIEFPIPYKMSITEYFRTCLLVESKIMPDAPAILNGDGKSVAFTFRQLDSLSTKFAKALRESLGFWTSNSSDGDIIMAFALPPSEIIPIVILGILKLGAAYLAIPITFAEQHIIKLVYVTRPMLVLIDGSNKPNIARYECVSSLLTVFHIETIMDLAVNGEYDDINEVFPLEALDRPSKRMASVVYTAGTMGQQLAVRIGHLEILNRCLWQHRTFPYEENEVAAVSSCLEDVDSISEIFAPLLAGVRLHILPRYFLANPTGLIWRISEAKISRITLAPRALAALISAYEELNQNYKDEKPLESLQYWTVSGDTLSLELAKKFFRIVALKSCDDEGCARVPGRGSGSDQSACASNTSIDTLPPWTASANKVPPHPIIIHLYGSTEVMSDVTYQTFENCKDINSKFSGEKVSIGRPIGNTHVYVVDEDNRIVEEGTIGEIFIAGACVASGGYVAGTEVEDADRFLTNPFTNRKDYRRIYETEDFGRITKDKRGIPQLYFEGRMEMTAKVNGKLVDLRDISVSVYKTKLVEQCSVFTYLPGQENQAIVACCMLRHGVTQVELETALMKRVHDKDLIPQIFPVEEFHYLPSGRLDKHKMFKRYKWHTMEATPEEWEPVITHLNSPILKGPAKVLFSTIATYTGRTLRTILANYQKPMWAIGVNSINALSIFLKVRENGYVIEIADFLQAETIVSIVFDMRARVKSDGLVKRYEVLDFIEPFYSTYGVTDVGPTCKNKVIELLSEGYSERNYLACFLSASVQDYMNIMELNWPRVMKDNLSVVAYKQKDPTVVVGACIVVDAYNSFKFPPNGHQKIKYMQEVLHHCEKRPKEHIIWKNRGKAIQTLLIGTSARLSPLENIVLVMELLEATKVKAKSLGYNGAIISCSHPLLRTLCDGIMHDQILGEFAIHKFRAKDKTTPFRLAAPHHKIQVFYEKF